MSLKEVLMGLVNRLNTASDKFLNGAAYSGGDLEGEVSNVSGILEGIAVMLPDEQTQQIPSYSLFGPVPVGSVIQHKEQYSHQALMAQAQQEARLARQKSGIERAEPRMLVCADGPEEGTYVPCPPDMPEEAFTRVGNSVYQLKQGKLVLKKGG